MNPSSLSQTLNLILLGALVVAVGVQAATIRSFHGSLVTFMQTVDLLNSDRPLIEDEVAEVTAGNGPSLGGEQAPVTIVAFSDFDCGACRQLMPSLHELVADAGDDIRLAYRHFPLRMHGASLEGAVAAECAFRQGQFWPMHDLLLANESIDADATAALARKLDLDTDAFASCVADADTRARIEADRRDGQRFGVEGTPTLFINGRKVAGSVPPAVLAQMVDQVRRADA